MQAHNSRSARLGLESLEGRIVLSTTALPAHAPVVGQQSAVSALAVEYQSDTAQIASIQAASVTRASFSYSFSVGPRSILLGTNTTTANGKSSGSVAMALVRNRSASAVVGGPAVSVRVGFVTTTGSATPAHPDRFTNVPFSVTLHLRDAASGRTADVVFRGAINGTMSWQASHLRATFWTPTQHVTLGNHVYTVTMPSAFTPAGPYEAPVTLYAKIQVSARR
jgi:hypothetical protein